MKISVLLLLMSMTGFEALAQSPSSLHLSFNHLALSVTDLNRAAEFYKDILGLEEITNRTAIEGIRWFSLEDGKELHLISVLKEPVTINKAVHLALTTDDFDGMIRVLTAHHIPYSDWPGQAGKVNVRSDGILQIYFQDPDGYWIEVNSVGTHKQ